MTTPPWKKRFGIGVPGSHDSQHQKRSAAAAFDVHRDAPSYLKEIAPLLCVLWAKPPTKTAGRELESLFNAGRFAEARQLAERHLRDLDLPKAVDAEIAAGKHPAVVSESLYWLARIQESEGDILDAEINYQLLVRAHERHGLNDSLQLARFRQRLGNLCLHKGEGSIARTLLEQSLIVLEASGAVEPGVVARALDCLAMIHEDAGDRTAAIAHHERALRLLESHYGAGHIETAPTLYALGRLRATNEEMGVAEMLLARAAAIFEQSSATTSPHPCYPKVLESLGGVYEAVGREQDADHAFKRAWFLTEQIDGPTSRSTGLSILAYANALAARGPESTGVAKKLFKKAIRIFNATSGRQHTDLAMAWQGVANLYANLYRYDYAEKYFRKSLSLYDAAGAGRLPMVLDVLNCLASICRELGKIKRAKSYEKRAASLRRKHE